eukprot:scaffold9783_cov113-Cylindrotheca_fusiformis.AAC.2
MGTTESIFYEEETEHERTLEEHTPRPAIPQPTTASAAATAKRGASGRKSRPPPPIQRIRGLVLGGPQTGKRTLLARLQGSDPFASGHQRGPPLGTSATIPYLPPDNKKCWDRILLQVQASQDVTPKKTDFAILIVRPQHNFESTLAGVAKTVNAVLKQLGYHNKQSNGQEDTSKSKEPVCICILFNFRDETQLEPQQQEELKKLVEEITYDQYQVPKQKVVLKCAETSLRNCYGLNALHHFIYKTYLQRKQTDLKNELDQVQAQMDTAEDLRPVLPYTDFMKVLEATEEKAAAPGRNRNPNDTTAVSPQNVQRSQQPKSQLTQPSNDVPASQSAPGAAVVPRRGQTGPRRTIVGKHQKQKQVASPLIGKDALEAFLASSSDEDEPKQKSKVRYKGFQYEDDDDDDDDFFYDEGGLRQFNHYTHRNQAYMSDDSSTSSEDSTNAKRKKPSESTPKPGKEESKAVTIAEASAQKVPSQPDTKDSLAKNVQNGTVIDAPQEPEVATDPKPKENGSIQNGPPASPNEKDTEQSEENDSAAGANSNRLTPKNPEPEVAAPDPEPGEENGSNQEDPPASPNEKGSTNESEEKEAASAGANSNSASKNPKDNNKENNGDGWSDDDYEDEDDFMIESTPPEDNKEEDNEEPDETDKSKTPPKNTQPVDSNTNIEKTEQEDDDDEDDEFIVGEGGTSETTTLADSGYDSWDDEPSPASAAAAVPPSTGITPSAASNGGISAAALAAIAAAQQEAEAMLLLNQGDHASLKSIPEEDRKKKKKKKKEKKKKRSKE